MSHAAIVGEVTWGGNIGRKMEFVTEYSTSYNGQIPTVPLSNSFKQQSVTVILLDHGRASFPCRIVLRLAGHNTGQFRVRLPDCKFANLGGAQVHKKIESGYRTERTVFS